MNQTVTYLQELTAIPSPTGFTREIADYLVKTIEGFGYEVTRTAKGGVNVTIPGVITDKQRYVTAHVDTLGAIVRAVKPDGRLKLDRIGGFPWNMIEGENCTVHVANTGKTIRVRFWSIRLLATSTRRRGLSSGPRTIWKSVWMKNVTNEKGNSCPWH